jgi:type II secretory pathway pseudopilin PulG
MTLVELLVVLAILALLTSVAVTSTDVLMGQARHDAARHTLSSIEDAVLGDRNARQSDGTLLTAGFLADMGRLPACASTDLRYALKELWDPTSMPAFAIRSAPFDAEVLVPCGWRGPYVHLPIAHDQLLDGWGNPFVPLNIDGNAAAVDQPLFGVRCLGADRLVGGVQYDTDFEVAFGGRVEMTARGNVYVLDAAGKPQNPSDPAQIKVRLYGPHPTHAEVQETLVATTSTEEGVVSYSVTTTIGPRFLRAYLGDPPTRKSRIVRFERGDVINLEIR